MHFWSGWRNWRHVTKLDPDRENPPELIRAVLDSGTDALIVGGTQGLTADKVRSLYRSLDGARIPRVVEVSHPSCLILGADAYFIPVVMNSNSARWIIGEHASALGAIGPWVGWSSLFPGGYLFANPTSAAYRATDCGPPLTAERAAALARVADGLLRLPIVYVDYSGRLGDPGLVAAVRGALSQAALFYGGGIQEPDDAARMAALADTVIVGNLVYQPGGPKRLAATVKAVRAVSPPPPAGARV